MALFFVRPSTLCNNQRIFSKIPTIKQIFQYAKIQTTMKSILKDLHNLCRYARILPFLVMAMLTLSDLVSHKCLIFSCWASTRARSASAISSSRNLKRNIKFSPERETRPDNIKWYIYPFCVNQSNPWKLWSFWVKIV